MRLPEVRAPAGGRPPRASPAVAVDARSVATVSAAAPPAAFLDALASLRATRLRPEIRLTEVPAPARLAPWAVALSAELDPGDDEDATTGRFVLLHDPAGQVAWEGTFRVVTLVRATLDPEVGTDPLLGKVAWTWVADALAEAEAAHCALGGTVTRVASESFGVLAERPEETEVEIRASWTPIGTAGSQLAAWGNLLCTAAGLPPLPAGVTALGRRY